MGYGQVFSEFPFFRDRSQFPFLSSPVLATSWDEEVGESRKGEKKKEEGQETKQNCFIQRSYRLAFLMSLIFGLVFCRVGKATPKQNDQRVVFYVFGSEDIYIVDPKSKAILSTIGPDGVCTKSNNRYSR